MPRYIDADDLRDNVLNDNTYDNDTVNYYLGWIDDAQTADVVPVVRGEWMDGVDYYEPPMVNPYFMVTHLICSKCGHSHGNPEKKPNFCPNCGADMRRESEVKV